MGWLEKFFCLSVDGPVKKLAEQVDEEMLKKSPVVPYVTQGVASSDIERWLMAERKAKNAVEFRGAKETVEGMRKREPSTWVEAGHQRHKAAKDSLKKEPEMLSDKELDLEKDSPPPPPVAGAPCPACKGPTQAMTFKHSGKDVDWCDRCKTGQFPEKSTPQFIGGGQQSTIDIRSSDGSRIGTCTITEAKTICLADHLKIHGQKYLIDLLSSVKYDYGDAVLKLCGNNLRLDVDEVQKNLRKHMVRLREQLIDEVQSWFCGNGRLLETCPEIVDCYLSCRNGGWWLEERDATTGDTLVRNDICPRLAHHLILASDVCNLIQEQKVMCLMNLVLRK